MQTNCISSYLLGFRFYKVYLMRARVRVWTDKIHLNHFKGCFPRTCARIVLLRLNISNRK